MGLVVQHRECADSCEQEEFDHAAAFPLSVHAKGQRAVAQANNM
jgi:hypothetical protein